MTGTRRPDGVRTQAWANSRGRGVTFADYQVYPIGTEFKEVGGIYIFSGPALQMFPPIYIGRTKNFRQRLRLGAHEEELCATQYGATRIHVLVIEDESERNEEERFMIDYYRPVCNSRHIHHEWKGTSKNVWQVTATHFVMRPE